MTAWVLIVVACIYGHGAGTVAIPNYPTQKSCVAAANFARKRVLTLDAYCVALPDKTQ